MCDYVLAVNPVNVRQTLTAWMPWAPSHFQGSDHRWRASRLAVAQVLGKHRKRIVLFDLRQHRNAVASRVHMLV